MSAPPAQAGSPSPSGSVHPRPSALHTTSPLDGSSDILSQSADSPPQHHESALRRAAQSADSPAHHHESVLRSAAQAILHSAKGVGHNLAELAASLAHPFVVAAAGASTDSGSGSEFEDEDDSDSDPDEGHVSDNTDEADSSDDDGLRPGEAATIEDEVQQKRFSEGKVLAREAPAFAHARKLALRKRLPSYAHLFPSEEARDQVVPIEDHGLIGNCFTTALISTDASICWYCYPHHDSPSLFHSLLDAKEGGAFTIHAGRELDGKYGGPSAHVTTKQLYHPETNVLLTRFFTNSGVGHCTDYLPCGDSGATAQFGAAHWLVRELECVRGKMYFQVDCRPSFNYGRSAHRVKMLPHGALFQSDALTMLITSSKQRIWKASRGGGGSGGGVRTKVTLEEGQRVVFVFREWREAEEERKWTQARANEALMARQRDFLAAQLAKLDLSHEIHPLGKYSSAMAGDQAADGGVALPPAAMSSSGVGFRPTGPKPPMNPSNTGFDVNRVHVPSASEADATAGRIELTPPDATVHSPDSHNDACDSKDKTFGTHTIRPISTRVTDKLRKETINFWRDWLGRCVYQGRWREMVRRSALLLKLLTFRPTGAIISAPTMCLPSELGTAGPDSRYVNLRDASIAASAFLRLGFRNEAAAFMSWLAARCQETQGPDGSLQLMYTIHGGTSFPPVPLEHIPGYRASGPVVCGNASSRRFCLDAYGTLLIAIYLSNTYAEPMSYEFWTHTKRLVNFVAENWQRPDEGMWTEAGEVQAPSTADVASTSLGEPSAPASFSSSSSVSGSSSSPSTPPASSPKHHFTVSKLMCWVALDRGIKLAHERSFPAPFIAWKKVRDDICSQIMQQGFDRKMNCFVQTYGSQHLDAALLLMPVTGFIAPTDPMFLATLDRITRSVTLDGLSSNSLVHRSNAHNSNASAIQVTTSVATFWCIEACTRAGLAEPKYVNKARWLTEQMLGFTSPLGSGRTSVE